MNIIRKKRSNNIDFKIFVKRNSKKIFFYFKKRRKIATILFVSVFLYVSLSMILSSTVFSSWNTINVIKFNNDSLKKIDDPFLYNDIMEKLKWKNFVVTRYLWLWKLKSELKKHYQIIDDIKLYKTQDNTVYVDVTFYKPSLIFNNTIKDIWVYKWHFFDISTGSSLYSWEIVINLPEYTKDWIFTWFFFKVSENQLHFQLEQIIKTFWNKYIKTISYIPWAAKTTVVLSDDKKLYFDNDKNVWEQLNKFLTLQKSYIWFNNLREIDLWSIDDIIVK